MELKKGVRYLLKKKSTSILYEALCLEASEKAYKLKFGGSEEWYLKEDFPFFVIEELLPKEIAGSEYEKFRERTLKEVEEKEKKDRPNFREIYPHYCPYPFRDLPDYPYYCPNPYWPGHYKPLLLPWKITCEDR